MANRKFVFVNDDNELEDSALSVSTSAGAGDSGKLITLDAGGKLDASFIPDSITNDRDWKNSVRVASTSDENISTAPATIDGITMVSGDRVLLTGQSAAADNGIYVYNGSGSAMTRAEDADSDSEVTPGLSVAIEEGTQGDSYAILTTNGAVSLGTTALTFSFANVSNLTGGDGISIAANVVDIDLKDTDSGLEFISSELAIDFADPSSEMGSSRAVKASDLDGNGANQGAKILGVDPASIPQSSQTKIQGVLEDMGAAIDTLSEANNWIAYTVDTGGVTKADLVYISGNDTCKPLPITGAESINWGVGLAQTTEAAAASVNVVANDTVLSGVLTSLAPTAGDPIYWDGSALTLSSPTGGGSTVWQVGRAKNADDLHVDIMRVKRNA